jgi:hypothetical protein
MPNDGVGAGGDRVLVALGLDAHARLEEGIHRLRLRIDGGGHGATRML